jgi:hypothetical protein
VEELRPVANCGVYEETSVLVCSEATACSLTGLLDALVTAVSWIINDCSG